MFYVHLLVYKNYNLFVYKLSYLFRLMFAIFRETTQRNLYNYKIIKSNSKYSSSYRCNSLYREFIQFCMFYVHLLVYTNN